MGLYYVLTNPDIVKDYGLENIVARTSCSKVVIFMISDSLSSATTEELNQSNNCVLGLEKNEIFFEGYDAYFKIVSFKEVKKKQMLKLQLITPNYQPKGENELFFLIEYKISNKNILVEQFEKIIIQHNVKIKKGKKTKFDLLDE